MTRIAIDPITRIEGHLRIEVEVDGRTYRLPIAGIRKAHLAPEL